MERRPLGLLAGREEGVSLGIREEPHAPASLLLLGDHVDGIVLKQLPVFGSHRKEVAQGREVAVERRATALVCLRGDLLAPYRTWLAAAECLGAEFVPCLTDRRTRDPGQRLTLEFLFPELQVLLALVAR